MKDYCPGAIINYCAVHLITAHFVCQTAAGRLSHLSLSLRICSACALGLRAMPILLFSLCGARRIPAFACMGVCGSYLRLCEGALCSLCTPLK
jgi:hypothetical protein